MKHALMFGAALILSATTAMACPYKDKVLASASEEIPQSTATTQAPAPEQSQAPVEVAEEATTLPADAAK